MPRALLVACALGLALAGCGGSPPTAPASTAAPLPTSAVPAATVSAVGALSGVSPSGAGGVVVAPFDEADVVKVAPGDAAEVTVDAVPGTSFPGRVMGVAPAGVTISGVTEYYVTVVLTAGDPRLRAGQTAEVTVRTG